MYKRFISEAFLRAVKSFPAVILTGARQVGKSTLCKTLLKASHRYVSLEDPDYRQRALEDPRTFLQSNPPPLILDEIQYAPHLLSYLQGIIDENREQYGQYVLTGSQNFLLMEQVSQSLAGRAALLTLFPCSVAEVGERTTLRWETPEGVADWLLRGGYPELRSRSDLDRRTWCASYVRLYLERDVRRLLNVGDLDSFERFLRLMAIRTGQLLNLSDLARDAGVSVSTAKRWISVLQASYQVFLLQPFYANISKRLIKSPKIYFGDTALASYLMGIYDSTVLLEGPCLGNLFETAVVLEHLKWGSRQGDLPRLSFFRTKEGVEVDLIIEERDRLYAREMKAGRTHTAAMADGLLAAEALLGRPLDKSILSPVAAPFLLGKEVRVHPWHDVAWE